MQQVRTSTPSRARWPSSRASTSAAWLGRGTPARPHRCGCTGPAPRTIPVVRRGIHRASRGRRAAGSAVKYCSRYDTHGVAQIAAAVAVANSFCRTWGCGQHRHPHCRRGRLGGANAVAAFAAPPPITICRMLPESILRATYTRCATEERQICSEYALTKVLTEQNLAAHSIELWFSQAVEWNGKGRVGTLAEKLNMEERRWSSIAASCL